MASINGTAMSTLICVLPYMWPVQCYCVWSMVSFLGWSCKQFPQSSITRQPRGSLLLLSILVKTPIKVVKNIFTSGIWYLTSDIGHVLSDIWHLTHDWWWTLCQNFSSWAQQFESNNVLKIWRKGMNESIN